MYWFILPACFSCPVSTSSCTKSSSGQSHSHLGLGRCRPDGCGPRHPRKHASWPTIPAFPDGSNHPDGKNPQLPVRRHSWANAPACDSGSDVRDQPLDGGGAAGPSAGGRPVLRDRGHAKAAVAIDTDLDRNHGPDRAGTVGASQRVNSRLWSTGLRPASGAQRDQAQQTQPDCAPAEQQRRSKRNGNPFPPLQPVCGPIHLR